VTPPELAVARRETAPPAAAHAAVDVELTDDELESVVGGLARMPDFPARALHPAAAH
jgi:hypothetical protein